MFLNKFGIVRKFMPFPPLKLYLFFLSKRRLIDNNCRKVRNYCRDLSLSSGSNYSLVWGETDLELGMGTAISWLKNVRAVVFISGFLCVFSVGVATLICLECPRDLVVPAAIIAVSAGVRLVWMFGSGNAQAVTASTILRQQTDSFVVDNAVRHERRMAYKQWLWWSRFGVLVTIMQVLGASYLVIIIVKSIHGHNSSSCYPGQDGHGGVWKQILVVVLAIVAWVLVIAQCCAGSDVLAWRSFYARHDGAWKAHYREMFDHGIREILCCLGRAQYLSILEADEVDSVAGLLGDLVAYRAAGAGHLEFLADEESKAENQHVFHDQTMFLEDYKEMKKKFKIYAYPHEAKDEFANIFLPVDFKPSGNYASESYFKKALMQSHFITNDPTEADIFFLPFSIATMRHDSRVSVGGIKDFVKAYIDKISQKYPYWNRTNGADHFYVACHSVGRTATDKAEQVRLNAIQVVCSSSYFIPGYVAHKDVSLPQIWPREENSVGLASMERSTLAFFAGAVNSPVRVNLLETWKNDSEISVHFGRLSTPYSEALLRSKFCLHVKGFEVNTARIGDALYYGCIPIIFADHYDLPFNDVLNWKSFSLVVATLDTALLKDVLHNIGLEQYNFLKNNALKVRKHFQWDMPPRDYDAFNMVMYELWLRRCILRIHL